MSAIKEKINLADIAFLQAYLLEMFEFENECEQNFKHTKWYLQQKFDDELAELYLTFIKEHGATCDCDVIRKINIKKEAEVKKLLKEVH